MWIILERDIRIVRLVGGVLRREHLQQQGEGVAQLVAEQHLGEVLEVLVEDVHRVFGRVLQGAELPIEVSVLLLEGGDPVLSLVQPVVSALHVLPEELDVVVEISDGLLQGLLLPTHLFELQEEHLLGLPHPLGDGLLLLELGDPGLQEGVPPIPLLLGGARSGLDLEGVGELLGSLQVHPHQVPDDADEADAVEVGTQGGGDLGDLEPVDQVHALVREALVGLLGVLQHPEELVLTHVLPDDLVDVGHCFLLCGFLKRAYLYFFRYLKGPSLRRDQVPLGTSRWLRTR